MCVYVQKFSQKRAIWDNEALALWEARGVDGAPALLVAPSRSRRVEVVGLQGRSPAPPWAHHSPSRQLQNHGETGLGWGKKWRPCSGAVREAAAAGAETLLRDHRWPTPGQGPSDGPRWHWCETLRFPWPGEWCCLQLSTNRFCWWLSCRRWWGGSEKVKSRPLRKAGEVKTTHRNQTWGSQPVDKTIDLSLKEELGVNNY